MSKPQSVTEQIFQALFGLVQTVVGTDWGGNSVALQYFSRNWAPVGETADGTMPALYQWDPRAERDVRTGLGRSRRLLHAQVDIRIQVNQIDQYPDNLQVVNSATIGPLSTVLNNWVDALYGLFSPADGGPQTLTSLISGAPIMNNGVNVSLSPGVVSDCYPISMDVQRGALNSRVAVIYAMIEIVRGG